MKLLVDMGNSALKWTTISDGVLSHVNSSGYDDFSQQLQSGWQTLSKPESITVSCVTHEPHWHELSRLTKAIWDTVPDRVVWSANGCGVVNAYQRPENLGSDRWAAMIGAHALYQSDVCIVGCGTALTIDLLSANGQHQGGVIAPGSDMMQNSLLQTTAAISQSIPHSLAMEASDYWGQDTQSGIIKGSWVALAGAVRLVYEQYAKQSSQPICILSGGGAETLATYLDIKVELEPALVLKGLAVIAGENITA